MDNQPNSLTPGQPQLQQADISPRQRRWLVWVSTLTPLLVAVVGGVFALANGWRPFSAPTPTSAPVAGAVASPSSLASQAAARITIIPPGGDVPRCVTVNGTATVPGDVSVWLALHGVGKNGKEDADFYGFTPAIVDPSDPDRWHASMELGLAGDIGKTFVIFAFPVHQEANRLLANFRSDKYYFKALPVQDGVVSERFRRDRRDTALCS